MEAGDHEGAKVLYEEALRTTGGDGRFESRVRCQMGLYQMAEEAKSRFETYIQVFGPDEAAQHEIDFLNTRIR